MKKYIALTFDDGPNTILTPAVLKRLEKFGIAADTHIYFRVRMIVHMKLSSVINEVCSVLKSE